MNGPVAPRPRWVRGGVRRFPGRNRGTVGPRFPPRGSGEARSPYRGRPWIVRQTRAHPLLFVAVLVCVAAVFIEVAATTHFFGLVQPSSGGGSTLPSLNPYGEVIFAVNSSVTYHSGSSGYFPALDGTDLCQYTCPKTPVLVSNNGNTSIGVFFYVNVTNTATTDESLSNLTLTTSGANTDLFSLVLICCYPTYQEPFSKWTDAASGATVGLRGYAYVTVPIPYTGAGGYSLLLESTSP